MSLADHIADDDPDPPPSPWRWVVALALAGLTLGVGMLVRRENDRAAALKKAAESPIAIPGPSAAAPSRPPGTAAPPASASSSARAPASKRASPSETDAAALSAPASGPHLRITSDVKGAFVFLDRKYVGVTPLDTTDVAPGSYQLKVSAEGVGSVDQPLDVAASGATDVSVALGAVRLHAHVDVVHKHAMGSCEGRLVATPAGLRYETRHASDAFSVPLGDLERLEVDYLKKTLTVKPRGGRTFNFTTRAANADPLVVFEHSVSDARRRRKP